MRLALSAHELALWQKYSRHIIVFSRIFVNIAYVKNTKHATTTDHDDKRNEIMGKSGPKCKQVKCLMTILGTIRVRIIRLIILINPEASTGEPGKEK